jgi:outer membrane murein-binding lipoprotein Lpp
MTINPNNKIDECAMFTIDDPTDKFVLSDVINPGENYVFSFWARSDAAGNLVFRFNDYPTSTNWEKYIIPFTTTDNHLLLSFSLNGTYYIYHPKLELGNRATDWTPAPEDTDDKIEATNKTISELRVDTSGISSEVRTIKTNMDELTGKWEATSEQVSTLTQTASDLNLRFQKIDQNGVSQVVTETGFTFDRAGMTVDSTDSQTKTQVTPDGMTVYNKNTKTGLPEEVLTAKSSGVDATNLRANTYLIVGGRSRFENYGNDRTGCFWIGG